MRQASQSGLSEPKSTGPSIRLARSAQTRRLGVCDVGRSEVAALEQKRHIVVAGASVGETVTEIELSVVPAPLTETSECSDCLVSDLAGVRYDVDSRL